MKGKSKTALITGATSGIGSVMVKHLVKSGYSVIVLARSGEKLSALVGELQQINSELDVEGIICDLSSYESVYQACNKIKENYSSLDLLVLNAGLWNFKFVEDGDGIEETLHVNLISPVQIFIELVDLLHKNGSSKVIFTSSGLHQGTINFDDPEYKNNFSGFKVYRQSKLGLLLLTRWLSKQSEYSTISFYCVHPGMVNTQLGRNANWFSRSVFQLFGKSKEKGASTHNYLIDQDTDLLSSGEYYANKKVTKTTKYSYNMNVATQLWDVIGNYLTKLKDSHSTSH